MNTFSSSWQFHWHITRFHSKCDDQIDDSEDTTDFTFAECDNPISDQCNYDRQSSSSTPVEMNHYSKNESKTFFRMIHEGYSYADAIMQISFPDVNPGSFSDNEKLLHLLIADMCSKVPKSARHSLAKLVKLVESVVLDRLQSKSSPADDDAIYPLPKTPGEIRNLFMEGRRAVLPNLAHPDPVMLDDDHSYVSPIDVFAHHCGYGIPSDVVVNGVSPPSVTSITESLRACQMVFNSKMVNFHRSPCDRVDIVPSLCWSDKAEIHRQKTNRKSSAWCKTMTIQPPKDRQNCAVNTYVISLGSHDGCRQNVERRFIEDFQKLCSGSLKPFYDGVTKSMSHVHSELMCDIRDIPERVEGLFLGAGNGTYTRIFRYSVNFSAKSIAPQHTDRFLYEVFASCEECMKRREQKQEVGSDHAYDCCADWNLLCNGFILHTKPPANYPESEIPSCGSLGPLELSTQQLTSSSKLAFDSLITKSWKQSTVTAYLQRNGLNSAAIENTSENAARYLRIDQLTDLDVRSAGMSRELSLLQKLLNDRPSLFSAFLPATWNLLDLRDFAESVMHHLCQGSSSHMAKDVDISLKADGKHSLLLRETKGRLDSVAKLRLDWLKALDEGENGKRGGYVGENYLALIQLMPWYYSIIPSLFQMQVATDDDAVEEYVEPDKPIDDWRVDELKLWLKAHGLTQKGKDNTTLKADLRARIIELMESDTPPMLNEAVSGASANDISQVVIALKAMVSRIMTAEVNSADIDEIDRHIKLFMSYYERFWMSIEHKEIKSGKKKHPKWMMSTKQASLLLLPETIRRFGPLRGLWEGGSRGEGGLRPVKDELSRFHGKWQLNAHRRIMQKKVLSHIMNDIEMDDDDRNDATYGERSVRFYSFNKVASIYEAEKMFLDGSLPMSVLQTLDGTFGIPMSDGQFIEILRGELYSQSFGYNYFWWSLTDVIRSLDDKQLAHNCCFLPKMHDKVGCGSRVRDRVFTGFTSRWLDMQADGTFGQIRIPGVEYSY